MREPEPPPRPPPRAAAPLDEPSRTPTEPPPTTVPEVVPRPEPPPEYPVMRLSVELRLLGMVATLWWLGLVHAAAWAHWAGPPWRDPALLPWASLVVPQVLALGLVLGHLVRLLPRTRWPRRRRTPRTRDPRPWLVLGLPALPLAPWLWLRDRRARRETSTPAQVDAAFESLLHTPRSTALRFASFGALAYVVDAVVLGAHAQWPRHVVVAMALLWLAILGPLAAMVHAWSRAMLRPEVLCAPRADASPPGRRTSLRASMILVATVACAGALVAPLAAGHLWLAIADPMQQHTPALLELSWVGGVIALLACVATFVLLAVDLRRDVVRASAQVAAVVREQPPEQLMPGSLCTGEIYQMVDAVDRLIGRIRKATIAKYVAIERAKEGDRLKSQFLANMSHDLRSPLNSIIGFSELLLRGIDGELGAEQREMVQTIHGSGRELLQQIDDILDTAKLEAHRLDLHPEPTPPINLVNRAIHNARARQRGIVEYQTEVAPGLRPAFVDPFRMVQALTNILLFAGERMESGTLRIGVREGRVGDRRRIFVQVQTPVRPASTEHLGRARRGFYRIPGHRGLGLGLPIAGAILELSGGSLSIEDLGRDGMVFTAGMPSPQSRATYLRMRAIDTSDPRRERPLFFAGAAPPSCYTLPPPGALPSPAPARAPAGRGAPR
ncbi:MAG: HAMP domain-containing histidine kinase, partial [Myxococcales bacterium]|nr:HAMP domain-containing histidine kinase [Myxococcales bacterium]